LGVTLSGLWAQKHILSRKKTTTHVINCLIWTSRGWVVQRADLIFKNRHQFHFSEIGYPLVREAS
jgi:hypothetical protein